MSTAISLPVDLPALKLQSQPAGAVLRQIGQTMGVNSAPTGRIDDLPPWSQEDADAFELALEEICWQVKPWARCVRG